MLDQALSIILRHVCQGKTGEIWNTWREYLGNSDVSEIVWISPGEIPGVIPWQVLLNSFLDEFLKKFFIKFLKQSWRKSLNSPMMIPIETRVGTSD